ncbi:MAG: YidC/Oxa1 family insertase periplasmic-domain containing protein, partial [Candidatus Neomarinimicrobiota bacterium]|nr:YidC/Oxa1 family insertase periplasmic-domain containing protein [Candidatus Neomarinimicrobiota bacterium]
MDRQSLLAFLLIGLIIVFYPWYMSIVAPPSLEDQKDLTEQSQYLNEPTTNKIVTPQAYDKNVGPQKLVNVTTNLYSLNISTKNGGSINKYQLFRFLDYKGQLVDLINDDNKNNLALSFVSIDGDEVVLDGNWNLKESVSSLRAERTQKTLTFSTTYLDQEITKTYTFYPDSYSIGLDVSFTNPSEFIS